MRLVLADASRASLTGGMRDRVIGEVFNGDVWDDKAADVARDSIEGLMRGIGTSYDDLDAIGAALTRFGRKLGEAQHLLMRNVGRAEENDVQVDAQGNVIPPEGNFTKKEAAQWTAFVDDCQRGVNQAIDIARSADYACASALRAHASALPTLKQLNATSDKVGHQGLEAANLAQQLLNGGAGSLTADELRQLHNLLRRADDPAFSTQFLEALGPEKALRLNLLIAEAGSAPGFGFRGLAADVQDDLAQALASATDKTAGHHVWYSDSADFTGEDQVRETSWMERLKAAGRVELDTMVDTLGGHTGEEPHTVSGYHSLAALLDDAEFSSDFLNEVGRDMYRYDVTENPGDWSRDSGASVEYDLDLGDPNETGLDPMSGLMEGLANNPEAAQDFFSNDFEDLPKDARDPADYLLTGRDWGDGDNIPGTSNLGDALETATTTTRNQTAAEIMGQAVHSLGSDPATMPANMRDSFGGMISHWIDDVNHGIGGWSGDKADDSWTIPVDLEEVPGNQPHAYFKSEEILEVMGEAAKDPEAYREMWDHQRAYTAMALDHAAAHGTDSDFTSATKVSSHVFGALTEANADAAKQLAQQSVAGLDNAQAVTNFGIGAAVGAAGTVFGGPVGAAAGSLVAQGGTFAVNELVENMKQNATAADYQNIEAIYGNGERAVQDLVDDAIWRNEAHGQVPDIIRQPGPDGQPGEPFEYGNGDPVRLVDALGRPIPLEDMDQYQQQAYNTWMENQGRSQDLQIDVKAAIKAGQDRMRDASLPGLPGQG